MPKGVVGDQAFFQDMLRDSYKFHGITPYPCGPRTPWPNRAETAVRLFKRAWVYMDKSLEDEGFVDKVTVRQAVKNVVWARNCQLTVSGYSPLEIATGRRPAVVKKLTFLCFSLRPTCDGKRPTSQG